MERFLGGPFGPIATGLESPNCARVGVSGPPTLQETSKWPPEEMPELFLTQASVVLLAQHHNILDFEPHRLADRGVVPPDWKVQTSATSPFQADIAYDNGVTLEATPVRLAIGGLADTTLAHEVASAYVKAFPLLAYGALGLNVQIAAKLAIDPTTWLTSLVSSADKVGGSVIKVTLCGTVQGNVSFQLELSSGAVKRDDAPEGDDVVILDFNIHHPKGLTAEGLCEAIQRWPEYFNFIDSTVQSLVGDRDA